MAAGVLLGGKGECPLFGPYLPMCVRMMSATRSAVDFTSASSSASTMTRARLSVPEYRNTTRPRPSSEFSAARIDMDEAANAGTAGGAAAFLPYPTASASTLYHFVRAS